MGKQNLDNALRIEFMNTIAAMLEQHYDTDVLTVSTNELAIPVVDAENNEKFITVKVSVPRGTRNGKGGYTPYNGYELAEAYKIDKEATTKKEKE